jgi:hypothetical protein
VPIGIPWSTGRRLRRARQRRPGLGEKFAQVLARRRVGAVVPRLLPLLVLALLVFAPATAWAQGFKSANVSVIGKLPDAAGAIGARFSPDGRTMYVTGATGLGIYDVSAPAAPRLLSRLPLPHFENEDVDVGRDTVVITNDPSFSGVGALYLIDVSDPSAPAIRSVLNATFDTGNGHIANCIADCTYLYTTGTSEGLSIYDIRDLANPRFVKTVRLPGDGFTHDVNNDAHGVTWVTGEDGTFGFDTSDPLNPRLLLRSDESITNTGGGLPGDDGSTPLDFLHHNSLRISDDVLAVTEEDYAKPTCEGQGSLQTWRITDAHNADGTQKLELLDLWTTELNELISLSGRSPATVNCSAHWFDESGGLLAQGWYDQGVRFLDVSTPTDIRQVGFYATSGTFWGAYFAPTDPTRQIVYALDVTSGIDVLRIDRGGPLPAVSAPARLPVARTAGFLASPRSGFACQLPISPGVGRGRTLGG